MSRTKPSVIERKRRRTNENGRKRTNRRTERNLAPPRTPPPNTPVAHKRTKSYIKHTRYCIIGGYYISGTGAWRRYQQLPTTSHSKQCLNLLKVLKLFQHAKNRQGLKLLENIRMRSLRIGWSSRITLVQKDNKEAPIMRPFGGPHGVLDLNLILVLQSS